MPTAEERRDELKRVYVEASACTRCPVLAAERRTVVFGSGHPDAELMVLGTAPGHQEDEQGLPFVGASGRLLSELLAGIGLERSEVYVATAIKCRPPANREPLAAELAACRDYLDRQVALVRPKVLCTLGSFPTRLLRADPASITQVHGRAEVVTVGGRAVRLLPLFHPAAALYAGTLLETLRADVATIPDLLALPEPEQPAAPVTDPEPEPAAAELPGPDAEPPGRDAEPPGPDAEPPGPDAEPPVPGDQLGLF